MYIYGSEVYALRIHHLPYVVLFGMYSGLRYTLHYCMGYILYMYIDLGKEAMLGVCVCVCGACVGAGWPFNAD